MCSTWQCHVKKGLNIGYIFSDFKSKLLACNGPLKAQHWENSGSLAPFASKTTFSLSFNNNPPKRVVLRGDYRDIDHGLMAHIQEPRTANCLKKFIAC